MNIPEPANLDIPRFGLCEATEALDHHEYELVRGFPTSLSSCEN
jgi:hypothetical protein